jgi:hypothetical protein
LTAGEDVEEVDHILIFREGAVVVEVDVVARAVEFADEATCP